MRAVRFHQTGGPEVLKVEDIPRPAPGPGEVLLQVKAAALNRMDVFLRTGATTMPGWSMPHTGGFDISGVVVETGPGVDASLAGTEAMIKSRVFGPSSRGRLDIVGINRPGGFAEFAVMPAECVTRKPASLSWEEAAAYPCCHITAYYGLIVHGSLRPGEIVLVHGGGSGAGAAACQVAKLAGATVITTVGNDSKAAKARELLHADHAINYRKDDFAKVVRDLTHGRGVDIVFDPVWGTTAAKTVDALAMRGRWILLGMVGGPSAEIVAARIMFKEIVLRGIVEFFAASEEMDAAFKLAHQGRVRTVVDRVWPLEQLARAHQQMESGDFFGKIVVTP